MRGLRDVSKESRVCVSGRHLLISLSSRIIRTENMISSIAVVGDGIDSMKKLPKQGVVPVDPKGIPCWQHASHYRHETHVQFEMEMITGKKWEELKKEGWTIRKCRTILGDKRGQGIHSK
jgi:hypothetical protein